MNRNYLELPKTIHDWLWLNKAWIVGSGVEWYLGETEGRPKDLDILIPFKEWNNACKLIDKNARLKINSFGGFKGDFGKFTVDFWPMNLEDFFSVSVFTFGKNEIKALRLNPYTLVKANKNESN